MSRHTKVMEECINAIGRREIGHLPQSVGSSRKGALGAGFLHKVLLVIFLHPPELVLDSARVVHFYPHLHFELVLGSDKPVRNPILIGMMVQPGSILTLFHRSLYFLQ